MRGSRGGGGQGVRTSLKNHKNIGFLSNTGPDPLKKTQRYQARFQYWAIIGPPAKRKFINLPHPPPPKKKMSELEPHWQNILDPRMTDCTSV